MDAVLTFQTIGAIVAISGLLFGLYQYTIAQKWKRQEFAAAQLEKLASDPELSLVCRMLDWAVRAMPVPEKYRPLTEHSIFTHDWNILVQAMRPEEDTDVQYEWQHVLYRDVFDQFFTYLEHINHAVSIGLISLENVSTLEYWLQQLAAPRFAPEQHRDVLLRFIERYGYNGVRELMWRFGVATPPSLPAS